MNILYYSWHSTCDSDCIDGLKSIGHAVTVSNAAFKKYDEDEQFIAEVLVTARNTNAEVIFSFNYFPDLSRTAMMLGVPYISWVYDSPHYTLESLTLSNPCNNIYIFDYELSQKYVNMGIDTVSYMPLACNIARLEKQLGIANNNYNTSTSNSGLDKIIFCPEKYNADISFLGRMYDDEQNFFAQIKYLPDRLKGYIEGVIAAQKEVYGFDLVESIMTEDIMCELKKYVQAQLGPKYRSSADEIIKNMIKKQITVEERRDFLKAIGDRFGEKYTINHYAPERAKNLPVNYKGYANYIEQMPNIFYTSKINLNISLRSIKTGIPLRVIDILGAGGFCLTNYQAELPEYFENGVDLVWFESKEDMLEKIEYYLSHEDERKQIAINGHKKAVELFSYERRLREIFQ